MFAFSTRVVGAALLLVASLMRPDGYPSSSSGPRFDDLQSVADSATRQILTRRISISIERATAYEFVQELRQRYAVPLSLIEKEMNRDIVSIRADNEAVEGVLKRFVAETNGYKFGVIRDHLVIYPADEPYFQRSIEVNLRDARIEAAKAYVQLLNREIKQLADLAPPPVKGNPSAPLYRSEVSLDRPGTVVEHLVALLGSDPSVVFSLVTAKSGVRILVFDSIVRN